MRLFDYKVFVLNYYMDEWFLEDHLKMEITRDMDYLLTKCYQEGLTIPMAAAELAQFAAYDQKQ